MHVILERLAKLLEVDGYESLEHPAVEEGDLYLHPSGRRFKVYQRSAGEKSIHLDDWLMGLEYSKRAGVFRVFVPADFLEVIELWPPVQSGLKTKYRVIWEVECCEFYDVEPTQIFDVVAVVADLHFKGLLKGKDYGNG